MFEVVRNPVRMAIQIENSQFLTLKLEHQQLAFHWFASALPWKTLANRNRSSSPGNRRALPPIPHSRSGFDL